MLLTTFVVGGGESPPHSPQVAVVQSSPEVTSIEISIPPATIERISAGGMDFHKIRLPEMENAETPGKPELPFLRFLVAIPKGSTPRIRMLESRFDTMTGSRIFPAQSADGEETRTFEMDEELYASDEYVPHDVVALGAPATMRDIQVVPVEVHPVQCNPAREELRVYRFVSLEITHDGGTTIDAEPHSPAFTPIYESEVLDYTGHQPPDSGYHPAGYLIITPDEFYDAVLPLAEWKHRKGSMTTVARISEVGTTDEEIRNYIRDVYSTRTPRPSYVLLIGDTDRLVTHSLSYPPVPSTDHYYSMLEGDDYFSEVLVGRLSAASEAELNVIVAKILGYERNPYLDETEWFERALMVGGNYPSYVTTAVLTKKWVRDQLLAEGFSQVDTVFYPPTNDPAAIAAHIDNGVSFVNYRGWARTDGWHYPEFRKDDVYFLSNGWELPVVTSITCGTGNFGLGTCFGEAWLRTGTPTTPRGAVAFVGPTSLQTSTKYNNCIDSGFYRGLLHQDLHLLGQAMYKAKLEVYRNMPHFMWSNQNPEFYFHAYNVLGDPGLVMWTSVPESLSVAHPPTAPVGHSVFEVEVRNSNLQPVEDAVVCLWKGTEVYSTGLTDGFGVVRFSIEPTTPDTMWVTATCHNYLPYLSHTVVQSRQYVGYDSHVVDDLSGNGDGNVNPGEAIDLEVHISNYGSIDTVQAANATLASADLFVTISDSVHEYGDLPPGTTAAGAYGFSVSEACTNDHQLVFTLTIASTDSIWTDIFEVLISAPALFAIDQTVIDPDSTLDPGETLDFVVALENRGRLEALAISGLLRSPSTISVVDSLGTFGDISVGGTSENSLDPFTISVPPSAAEGRTIWLTLQLSGSDGFTDSIALPVLIGSIGEDDPLGPDEYGYYAYDSHDTLYGECPVYEWLEIDSLGTVHLLDNDETFVVPLGFDFTYYGSTYDQISICSNGWLSLGSTWMVDAQNWHIPAALGPPCLVAPFWDELDPTFCDSSAVYYYSDAAAHRSIIEWKYYPLLLCPPATECSLVALETFQTILYDPAHYPTRTGDGEIVFQYKEIVNGDTINAYATVGIEDEAHERGLEYSYDGEYPEAASPLAPELAIKFTTDRPDTFATEVREDPIDPEPRIFTSPASWPNPFRSETSIHFALPVQGRVILSVYDVSGRLVRELTRGYEGPGPQVVVWDGRDDVGRALSAGPYFVRFEAAPDHGAPWRALLKVIVMK